MPRSQVAVLIALMLTQMMTAVGASRGPVPQQSGAPAPALPGRGTGSVFRSGTVLVTLPVVVTDRQQRFVDALGEHDFTVFEDGVRQAVTFFAADRVPIDIAILLDLSSSMVEALATARTAATRLVESLHSGDRVTVMGIRDSIDMLHPLDDDHESAIGAIHRSAAGGATALYNGVYLALTEMVRKRPAGSEMRRQAIVLLSDGVDTVSLVQYDDVLRLARASGIVVYTISSRVTEVVAAVPTSRSPALQPQFVMRSLAHETGGRNFVPGAASELEGAYGAITEEIAHQYTLAYVPTDLRRTTAVRRIAVRVVNRPDLIARTRTGYSSAR